MQTSALTGPGLSHLQNRAPWLWLNPDCSDTSAPNAAVEAQIAEARDRMRRAEGLIRRLFDLPDQGGAPISSPLIAVEGMGSAPKGQWFIKADHALPIAGSIKARGGFHEVIAYAERLAIANGILSPGADLLALASPEARALFARHSVVVGSTGNLGLSIGLCGAALGFQATIHMSMDAKAWKKQLLRAHGAEVVEHSGDYGEAVARGRALAAADPSAHFVDDERSTDLFSGYACAAYELRDQLEVAGVQVDAARPLIAYLPCGVGGAPGGIAYGLRLVFGPHAHCFFAEPVDAPCMLVQLLNGTGTEASVYDIGLTNRTELDGLAVGTASGFVAPLMVERLTGIYTIRDDQALELLRELYRATGLKIEPSAATALAGPATLVDAPSLPFDLERATHISWTTGGRLLPEEEFARFLGEA